MEPMELKQKCLDPKAERFLSSLERSTEFLLVLQEPLSNLQSKYYHGAKPDVALLLFGQHSLPSVTA
eukprot:636154-Rhodomonas_salina.1